MIRWFPLLASLVGPAVVLGSAGAWWLREEEWAPSEQVQAMDASLVGVAPDVVVVGSSWAEMNVDRAELARGLDLDAAGVLTLSQRSSYPPIWYAMMKYRLAASEVRPRAIVVLTSLPVLTVTRVDERALPRLEQHYPSPDAALLHKTYGSTGATWIARLLARRGELRDLAVGAVRGAAVGLLIHDPAGRSAAELQDAAGAAVFGKIQGHGDAIATRLLPVVEHESAGGTTAASSVERVEDTYLPDLVALASSLGAHLVVVIPPVADFQRSQSGVAPSLEQAFVDYANTNGIGWLDLRSLPMGASDFAADGGHMRPPGAKTFTRELAVRLAGLGALGAGAMAPAVPAARILGVERRGDPPQVTVARKVPVPGNPCTWRVGIPDLRELTWGALATNLGGATVPVVAVLDGEELPAEPLAKVQAVACEPGFVFLGAGSLVQIPAGRDAADVQIRLTTTLPDPDSPRVESWWVYPGTELRFRVDAGAGPARIAVTAREVKGTAEGVVVEVDGVARAVEQGAAGLEVTIDVAPAPEHVVSVRSPPGGGWLVLRRLLVATDTRETELIRQVPLSRVDVLAGEMTAGPVPPLPDAPSGGDTSFLIPWSGPASCSPFQVLQDEVPLAPAGAPGRVGVWQDADRVRFRLAAGTDPADHHYRLAWDPDRVCAAKEFAGSPTMRWLLPGDRLGFTVDMPARRKLRGPLRVLYLDGLALTGGPAGTRLRLTATQGEETLLDAEVDAADLPAGVTLTLSRFVPVTAAEPVHVTLEAPSGAAPMRVSLRAMSQ